MQRKGESSDDRLPKFFRVYLPNDSGDDLEIPISFNSYLPSSVPKNVTVRNITGKVWKLKLRKHRGEPVKFSMVGGWKRIVKEEDLKGGEFLAFEFDGTCLFHFCVYGQTTCKRLGKPTEVEDEDDDVIVIDDDVDDDSDGEDEAAENDDDVEDMDEDAEDDDGMEADDDDHRQVLDDPDNPSFTVILNPRKKSQLLIPSHVMKDYNLNFAESITIIDPLVPKFGTLERKIKFQDNGSVFIKGFGSVFRRNSVKTTDKMICEVKKNANDVAHILKVYIVRG